MSKTGISLKLISEFFYDSINILISFNSLKLFLGGDAECKHSFNNFQ